MRLLVIYMGRPLPPLELEEFKGIRYCNPNNMFERVHILLPPDNKFFLNQECLLGGGKVTLHYAFHHRWLSNFNYLKILLKAMQIIKRERIDMIRAYNPHFCGLVGILAGKLFRIPCVISIHSDLKTLFEIPGINYLFRSKALTEAVERFCLRNAKMILIQAQHMRKYLSEKYKIPQEKFQQIKVMIKKPKGVFWNPDLNNFTVIFVGRHDEQKNLFCLFRAFKLIKSGIPQARLWIVGDGCLHTALKDFAGSLELEDVSFFGKVRPEKVFELLSCSCVFVHPGGRGEGFSNTILEAQSLGLPIVTTDIYPEKEFVSSSNALIFKYNDESECARLLLDLFRDKNLFDYYSQRSRASFADYAKANAEDVEESIYQQVLR